MDRTTGFIGGKFLPFHQGHVYAIIDASNRVDDLYVILSSSEKRDKEICERDGIKYIPAETRMSWIGRNLNDLDNITIVNIVDDHWDNDYDWEEGAEKIKEAIGKPIDFVFSSEHSYNEHFRKYYPGTKHIVIDDKRNTVTISATELRKNLYDHFDKLPAAVRRDFTKKVAVVGTESVGKSTLVKKLAKFYDTNYVHEVGRDYCDRYMNQLTPDMFDSIAMEHCMLQQKKLGESNRVLFVDSEAIITQYYLEMYFEGKNSPLVEDIAKIQNYDLVLYLEPDVPWVKDGVRFAGEKDLRKQNNQKLKHMFAQRGVKCEFISGDYRNRFNLSKELVDALFLPKNVGH